jgi:hypothetical protein
VLPLLGGGNMLSLLVRDSFGIRFRFWFSFAFILLLVLVCFSLHFVSYHALHP